jgi:hypothetical protein
MEIKRAGSQPSRPGPAEPGAGAGRSRSCAPATSSGSRPENHWHGAAPEIAMSHIAIQKAEDGRTVDWLEQVSEADYLG